MILLETLLVYLGHIDCQVQGIKPSLKSHHKDYDDISKSKHLDSHHLDSFERSKLTIKVSFLELAFIFHHSQNLQDFDE
jgi:hypothetical protein